MSSRYKIVLVGGAKAGKSTISNKLATGVFKLDYQKTIGAGFSCSKINDRKLQIWDTSGDPRFDSLLVMYTRDANLVLIIMDLSSKDSISDIVRYANIVRYDKSVKIVIGNKSDLKREVSYEEAYILAKSFGLCYVEMSSKCDNLTSIMDTIIHIFIGEN